MEVNKEFYGLETTWIKNTIVDAVSTTPEQYWFKVANVNPNAASAFNRQSRLIDYVDDGKLEFSEDLDYSICYAAMSGGPLCNLEIYGSVYTGTTPRIQSIIISNGGVESPCGWFFATLTDVNPSLGQQIAGFAYLNNSDYEYKDIIGEYYWKLDEKSIRYTRANNVSAALQPIVEFNPRGLYLAIMITIFDKQTGSFNNYTLDQVRTNLANNTFDINRHVMIRAYAQLYRRVSASESYTEADTSGSNALLMCPNKPFKFTNEQYGIEHEVINYGYRNNQITLMGWNGGNPTAYKFNHESDTQSLNDGNYYPYMRCFAVNPPSTVDNAASCAGNIWINTSYDKQSIEANYYNQGLGMVNYVELKEENFEEIRKAAACFGLFFTEKSGSSLSSNPDKWTSEDMFCGVLRDNAVGYGEYTRGEGNRENPIFNWTSSQQSNYDPSQVDPTPIPDTDPLLPQSLHFTLATSGTGVWALTPTEVH